MANIRWQPNKPQLDDKLSELDELTRSNKTGLRTALEESFYWSDSLTSAGQPRLSATTPGSCRAFYGPRSEVSDPKVSGTLMIVSDESRLIAFNSTQSVVVGGASTLFTSGVVGAQTSNVKTVVCAGSTDLGASAASTINYGVTYAGIPAITLQSSAQAVASVGSYVHAVDGSPGVSSFDVVGLYCGPGSVTHASRVYWSSCGTVSL